MSEGYGPLTDVCLKCGAIITREEFTDLYRIEGHHVHPKFMDNPRGLGRIINLCRDCHIVKLHPLVFEVIKKNSNLLKATNKGWWWVYKYHVLNKEKCIKEVVEATEEWLKL